MSQVPEDDGQDGHDRNHNKGEQCHPPVQKDHDQSQPHDFYRVLEQLDKDVGVKLVDGLHVVGDAGHHLAYRRQIEKAHGKAFHVFKQFVPHLVDDLLSGSLEKKVLDPAEDKQQCQNRQVFGGRHEDAGKPLAYHLAGSVAAGNVPVDGAADQYGFVQLQPGDHQDKHQTEGGSGFVGLHIGQHPQKSVALIVNVGRFPGSA